MRDAFEMGRLLAPGRNCSVITKANRFALLIDGSSYYSALAAAIGRANRSVVIVGWDFDSRVRLGPRGGSEPLIPPLAELFPAIATVNPDLNIYILSWDFPILYAHERDPAFVLGKDPFRHPRVHLRFDGMHPPGASHHQKIVAIDDALAFAGGMDIAGGRWDSPEHGPHDVRRAGKRGPYPPYHDVQAMVDGDAARALASVVRERWYRATGTSICQPCEGPDIWPDHVASDLADAVVGVSRTDAGADDGGGRLEVERLHLDLIGAARESIYIENQYLTSATVVAALSERLESAHGPEILIVLPLKNAGWLEEHTIEALRFDSIQRLRAADRGGRLRICYPAVSGARGDGVGVHSKILAVDDQWFRVGSSNLTNRSMRLDTECDVTIEATSPAQRAAVARLRNRLLAEHLGMSVEAVESRLSEDGSLVRLVDSRMTHARCLRDLPLAGPPPMLPLQRALVDPLQPVTPPVVIEALGSVVVKRRGAWVTAVALMCLAVAALALVEVRRSAHAGRSE